MNKKEIMYKKIEKHGKEPKMYRFTFIKDTRFSCNPKYDVIKMTEKLENDIVDIGILTVYPIREVIFDDCISYRRDFCIKKRKGYTWDNIFSVINKIYAPKYTRIKYSK